MARGSKATAAGLPRIVYHGTSKAFERFKAELVGSRHADVIRELGTEGADPTAFYFTNDLDTAIWYAKDSARLEGIPENEGVVMEITLRIDNPKTVNFHCEGLEYLAEEIEGAKNGGHDGLICRNYDDGGVSDHFVVFNADQIQIIRTTNCTTFA